MGAKDRDSGNIRELNDMIKDRTITHPKLNDPEPEETDAETAAETGAEAGEETGRGGTGAASGLSAKRKNAGKGADGTDDTEGTNEKRSGLKMPSARAGSKHVHAGHHKKNDLSPMESLDLKLEKETAANKKINEIYSLDPELHGQTRFQLKAREICLALIAALIGSLGTVSIMLANGLTYGGITGISRIIQHYTNWNYSLTYYALSMLVTATVWIFLGFKEVRKIILMSIAYPTFMFLIELKGIVIVQSDDLFLVAVFCGVFSGVSNGLTFKAGFSSGGTDSLAKVIKYRLLPHLGINDITFAINAIIVICSAFVFGVNIALYAIIITYVSMKVGEAVMYGFSDKIVELDIIPGDAAALTNYIMNELGRGVSSIEVTGEYTGDKRKQLKILCSPRESFLIKRHLAKNDPKSFVSVTAVKSVWGTGRGFSDIRDIEG